MIGIKLFQGHRLLHRTTLTTRRVTVGRSSDNDIVLNDAMVSRVHAVIERQGNRYYLSDHSTNGTSLDNVPVVRPGLMPRECTVRIHPFTLRFTIHADDVTAPLRLFQSQDESSLPVQADSHASPIRLHFGMIAGEDPSMHRVYQTIQRASDSTASVLLRGETGTGKELAAKAIHELSSRRNAPFVTLDCATIPEPLIESELFGFEKGAFTGASSAKKGWFEEAGSGTIFLDEIGELSLSVQAKLLRFLQDRKYSRLGGTRIMQTDARLIAATNRDLEEAVRLNQFRSDLYFRLRVIQIILPTLRDRRGDIPLLIEHIFCRIQREHNLTQRPALKNAAAIKLRAYHWPGNVRQLENVLYHAFIHTPPPHVIDEGDLDLQFEDQPPATTFDDVNRQFLLNILRDCNWDTVKAAKALNVSRATVYYKSKKFGINIKQLSG